jgi:hypothetical protein
MKLKNEIFNLALFGMILLARPAQAVIYADETPKTYGDSEDQNQDAVSRFGADTSQHKKASNEILPLDPISEASFAHDTSRAPASVVDGVVEGEGRGPASVKEQPADTSRAKAAIVNEEKRSHAYQEVAVIANDSGFYPSTVFLTQGIPTRLYITGASAKSQCFMLDQFGVRRQVRSQKIEEVTFVPDQAGTFSFNCPMNGAKGNVIVKELELGQTRDRMPASMSVSHSRPSIQEETIHQRLMPEDKDNKKSEIQDSDFTSEFRN